MNANTDSDKWRTPTERARAWANEVRARMAERDEKILIANRAIWFWRWMALFTALIGFIAGYLIGWGPK